MVTIINPAKEVTTIDRIHVQAPAAPVDPPSSVESVFEVRDLSVYYGSNRAVKDVSLEIGARRITAVIGPSGCGKSTFVRCLNRMNDLVPGARIEGTIEYKGTNLYGPDVDPVEVRKHIGMVFQKPNPFPKSIYDNVAFGPRVLDMTDGLDDRVERALHQASRNERA